MATGFGITHDAQGNGTTPEDIQAITAAEYPTPGVISGCDVTGTSAMQWHVNDGAVVIKLAPGRSVRVPVTAQNLTTEPAPNTGSRVEYIYVKQNLPASDGSNTAVVKIGPTVPANAVMLAKREIRAGQKSTSTSRELGNIVYAQPVGTSFGLLHHHYFEGNQYTTRGEFIRGKGSFYVPTDRNIDVRLTSTVSNCLPNGSEAKETDRGSVGYEIYIDGELKFFRERTYNNTKTTTDVTRVLTVPAGSHEIWYKVYNMEWGYEGWKVCGGGPRKFAGDQIAVIDLGVAKE
mgnify:FL=1